MTVRTLLRMGDSRLLQRSAVIEDPHAPEIAELLRDMRDTMQANDGAGLAAPQIGVPLRVIVFGVEDNPRYPDVAPIPNTVVINPEVTFLTDERREGWEGCLSVPGMRGKVPRITRLRYAGYDESGSWFEREVDGFHAVVIQHEVDHLDGVLYPMRIRDMRNFGFIDALENP